MQTLGSLFKGAPRPDGFWSGDSDDMLALHHADGRFLKVSDSAAGVTGHDPAALAGQPLSAIVAAEDRGAVFSALARACIEGIKARTEFRLLRRDGGADWAEMTVSVDGNGQVRSIIRDISSRRARQQEHVEARARAEAQAQARSTYLADLSHEIRTPLNAVIGFAEMMSHETFGPLGHQKYEEYVGLIQKSGQHLLSLVSDLLDLSRIEAERYTLAPQPTDLAALLRDCVEMVRLGAEEAGLSVSSDLPVLEHPVMADQKVVRQILLNLLSNAVKFTRTGGIAVKLRHDGRTAWISVTDTGIGMSREQLATIGKRFTSAQRDGVRGARGTGLGLALCEALARLHHGELRLASREGEGTRAVFSLPLKIASESEIANDAAGGAPEDALDALARELDSVA